MCGEQEEKQINTIEDQGKKIMKELNKNRVERILDTDEKSTPSLFPKDFLNQEATFEINEI